MSKTKLASLFLVGLAGYGVWALMAYYDPSIRGSFLTFNITMATGVIGLVLRDMPSDPPVVVPPAPVAPAALPVAPTPDPVPSVPPVPPVV
jgi:hypothetical protein